jgi:hypothetical protein
MQDCEISFDLARIDFRATSDLLMTSYWGAGRNDEFHRRAFANSFCAAAYIDGQQVGFGRAITDRTVFASSIIPNSAPSRTGACRPATRMASMRNWVSNPRRTADICALIARPNDGHTAKASIRHCCKIISVLGPDTLWSGAGLGDALGRLYKGRSAILCGRSEWQYFTW